MPVAIADDGRRSGYATGTNLMSLRAPAVCVKQFYLHLRLLLFINVITLQAIQMYNPAVSPGGLVPTSTGKVSKHKAIYAELRQALADGKYKPGDQFPTEAELVAEFKASRPTVARALARLESEKLVSRKAGAGTFVRPPAKNGLLTFGLLIPDLGSTEIFEPICQGMSRARLGTTYDLIWGATTDPSAPKATQAVQLCQSFIERAVSGVFFAPLELTEKSTETNHKIAKALDAAGIPVILLDRDIVEYPARSRYDLVGIDNQRAGFMITEHLLKGGHKRIVFLARPNSAPTVAMRAMGYRAAIEAHLGKRVEPLVEFGDPSDAVAIKNLVGRMKPDAIACANDHTAAHLITTLFGLSHGKAPKIRVTGIDDVKYAQLLPIPLTTIRQPCLEMGAAALMAMADRIAHPGAPARDVLVDFELVVREGT